MPKLYPSTLPGDKKQQTIEKHTSGLPSMQSSIYFLSGNLKTEPVSEIHHRDKDTLLCCTCSGDLNVLDLRSKQVKVNEYQCQGHLASFWTMSNTSNQSNELLLLSSNGEILKKDLRCLDENVERIQTSLHTSKCFECLLVQKGPTKDIFSISGKQTLIMSMYWLILEILLLITYA